MFDKFDSSTFDVSGFNKDIAGVTSSVMDAEAYKMGGREAINQSQITGAESILKGQRSMFSAEFQAVELRRKKTLVNVTAGLRGKEEIRQAMLVNSKTLARAAASGGASDPMIMRMMAKTAKEGAYRESLHLYEANEKNRDLEMQALTSLHGGRISEIDARYGKSISDAAAQYKSKIASAQADNAMAQAGISMFAKYGGGFFDGGASWNG